MLASQAHCEVQPDLDFEWLQQLKQSSVHHHKRLAPGYRQSISIWHRVLHQAKVQMSINKKDLSPRVLAGVQVQMQALKTKVADRHG